MDKKNNSILGVINSKMIEIIVSMCQFFLQYKLFDIKIENRPSIKGSIKESSDEKIKEDGKTIDIDENNVKKESDDDKILDLFEKELDNLKFNFEAMNLNLNRETIYEIDSLTNQVEYINNKISLKNLDDRQTNKSVRIKHKLDRLRHMVRINRNRIDYNKSEIDYNRYNIDKNTDYINNNYHNITDNSEIIDKIEKKINNVIVDNQELKSYLRDLNDKIIKFENISIKNKNDILDNQKTISEVKENMSELSSKISKNEHNIHENKEQIKSNTNQIKTNKEQIENISNNPVFKNVTVTGSLDVKDLSVKNSIHGHGEVDLCGNLSVDGHADIKGVIKGTCLQVDNIEKCTKIESKIYADEINACNINADVINADKEYKVNKQSLGSSKDNKIVNIVCDSGNPPKRINLVPPCLENNHLSKC